MWKEPSILEDKSHASGQRTVSWAPFYTNSSFVRYLYARTRIARKCFLRTEWFITRPRTIYGTHRKGIKYPPLSSHLTAGTHQEWGRRICKRVRRPPPMQAKGWHMHEYMTWIETNGSGWVRSVQGSYSPFFPARMECHSFSLWPRVRAWPDFSSLLIREWESVCGGVGKVLDSIKGLKSSLHNKILRWKKACLKMAVVTKSLCPYSFRN